VSEQHHYERGQIVGAGTEEVFDFIDDHVQFSVRSQRPGNCRVHGLALCRMERAVVVADRHIGWHLGYLVNGMLQRWMPIFLVVVVGAAPIAREICEISCAEHPTSASAVQAHDHSQAMAGHEMANGAMSIPETGASQPNAGDTRFSGHSHHEGESSCNLSLSHGAQACGHDHESQAESAPSVPLPLNVPAVVAYVQSLALPNPERAPLADGTDRPRASIPIALRTPLRV